MVCTYVAVLKCTVKVKVPKIKVEQNIQSIEKCERSSLIRFLVLKSLYFWGHSIHNAMMMLLVALKIIVLPLVRIAQLRQLFTYICSVPHKGLIKITDNKLRVNTFHVFLLPAIEETNWKYCVNTRPS